MIRPKVKYGIMIILGMIHNSRIINNLKKIQSKESNISWKIRIANILSEKEINKYNYNHELIKIKIFGIKNRPTCKCCYHIHKNKSVITSFVCIGCQAALCQDCYEFDCHVNFALSDYGIKCRYKYEYVLPSDRN